MPLGPLDPMNEYIIPRLVLLVLVCLHAFFWESYLLLLFLCLFGFFGGEGSRSLAHRDVWLLGRRVASWPSVDGNHCLLTQNQNSE